MNTHLFSKITGLFSYSGIVKTLMSTGAKQFMIKQNEMAFLLVSL